METTSRPTLTDEERVAPFIDAGTPKLIVRTVHGRNDATARTEITIDDFAPYAIDEPKTSGGGGTGPTPLQVLLGSLCSCKAVMIHNIASTMNFDYEGVELEAAGSLDLRGPKGVPGIRPYFESVDMSIVIFTEESEERVEQLAKNAENRCPVMNLLRDAGAKVTANWQIR